MYGKVFAQLYTGSMFGAGLEVMALWPYMLANCDIKGYVEVNPVHVASVLGCTADAIDRALLYLLAPDPRSRTKDFDGRRIEHIGGFLYRILNQPKYRKIRDEEARREYQRDWDREHRPSGAARAKGQSDAVRRSPTSPTQAEAKADFRERGLSPSIEDVRALWEAEKLRGDPERFHLWHEANGWPAVSWEAKARLWSSDEKSIPPEPKADEWGANRPAYADTMFPALPKRDEPAEGEPAPDEEPQESGEG